MASLARATLCAALLLGSVQPTLAKVQVASLSGCVTRADGSPIQAATISAQGATHVAGTTDARGCFELRPDGGDFVVRVDATGFEPFVRAGIRAGSRLDITLAPSASSLVTIGRVNVNRRGSLSASSATSVTLDAKNAAQVGFTSVSDMLSNELSLTAIRPTGGGANAPRVFSLRGPDPTETRIDIDGHEVNSGNTGDFDLSLLDPGDFQSVELAYGIAPSSLVGPNTIGGAINLRTLEPTQSPHALVRVSGGSYGLFGTTLQSTGTSGRIGYAMSFHRLATDNEIRDRTIAYAGANPGELLTASVGSGASTSSGLAKVRLAFGSHSTDGYAELSIRDQSSLRDQSAALSPLLANGLFKSLAGSFVASHYAGYGFDVRAPVGAKDSFGNASASLTFRHLSSTANQSVEGPIADSSSTYFFNDRDAIGDDTLEFTRIGAHTSFSLKAGLRTELLTEPFAVLANAGATDQVRVRRPFAALRPFDTATLLGAAPLSSLSQTQRSFVARYTFDAMQQVHATLATYYSDFSSFGTSVDPRVGLVWTPTPRTALRGSVGSAFQSPALTELFVPSPLPDASDRLVHIGNTSLKADHATEYDVGVEELVGSGSTSLRLGLDLYKTNLRSPAQTFVPASGIGYSYPVNVGGAIYQGIALRAERELISGTHVRLGYSLDNAFPTSVPAQIRGASLVAGKQFLGVPLQRGFFVLEKDAPRGFSYLLGGLYEGRNNELNEPSFVSLHGSLGYGFERYRIDVSGQNLTNVYAFGFTREAAGVAYSGATGPIPLDAYALPARRMTVSLSRHF